MRLDDTLLGYVIFSVAPEQLTAVLNVCGQYGIAYRPLSTSRSHIKREHRRFARKKEQSNGDSSNDTLQWKGSQKCERRKSCRKRKGYRRYPLPLPRTLEKSEGITVLPSSDQKCPDDFLQTHQVSSDSLSPRSNGMTEPLFFSCRLSSFPILKKHCEASGISLSVQRCGGLPVRLNGLRHRWGLLVGSLLAAGLLLLARSVLWDIRIVSDGAVDQLKLTEELAQCGLYPGCRLRAIKTDEIESRILEISGEVAWITVNIRGTVASVQVCPLLRPEPAISDDTGNLIANQDGIIESVKLLAGQSVVKPGQFVRKGELLVSGIRDSRTGGYFFRPADGEVMAKTQGILHISIPLSQIKKIYTGETTQKRTLFFFGKQLKFSKNTGITCGECDTIYKIERIDLPGTTRIPVFLKSEIGRIYRMESVVLDYEEAEKMAFEELNRQLIQYTSGGVLLSKKTNCTVSDEAVILECYYECLENIATRLPLPAAEDVGHSTQSGSPIR